MREKVKCRRCNKPATCIGAYEGDTEKSPACDDCCGHWCEDGRCTPIEETPDNAYDIKRGAS